MHKQIINPTIPKFWAGGKSFNQTKVGNFLENNGQAIGSITSGFGSKIKQSSDLTSSINQGFHSIMSSFGPIGAAASAITGTIDMIGGALGAKIDAVDQDAADAAGISSANTANQIIGGIPLVGTVGGIFAGKTVKGNQSAETIGLADAFSGSNALIDKSTRMGNKKMLFGRKKANRFIREQNRKNRLLTGISLENQLSSMNNIGDSIAAQNQNLYSGYSPQLMLAKQGAKLEEKKLIIPSNILEEENLKNEENKQLVLTKEQYDKFVKYLNNKSELEAGKLLTELLFVQQIVIDSEIIKKLVDIYERAELEAGKLLTEYFNHSSQQLEAFKSGGTIKNIIVEGALHARNHHLEDKRPELKDNITHKGIPVISKSGNEIVQHAEIERGELILTKEVTDQIENFYKDGSEQAMIDAGKLLARSLIKNTIDKTKELL